MPPTDEVPIEARNLERAYRTGETAVYALRGINLDVYRGEYVSPMSPPPTSTWPPARRSSA